MNEPLISIIMSVFNGEDYIDETINSVLNQEYKNIEFIIIDDASNDMTANHIMAYSDKRIKFIKNDSNMRLAFNLNQGIKLSNGKYIARIDADDICEPRRLQQQVQYMEEHTDVAVLGGSAQLFGASTKVLRYSSEHDCIKVDLLFENSICHPTVMFNKALIAEWYNSNISASQDYELWSRLIWTVKFHNMKNIFIKYRVHDKQTKHILGKSQKIGAEYARRNMLSHLCGLSNDDYEIFSLSCNKHIGKTSIEIQKIYGLYQKICTINNKNRIFNREYLKNKTQDMLLVNIYVSLCQKTVKYHEIRNFMSTRLMLRHPIMLLKIIIRQLLSFWNLHNE